MVLYLKEKPPMAAKIFPVLIAIALISCNAGDKTTEPPTPASTTEKPAEQSADKAAEIARLNEQSKRCIGLMNRMDEAKSAAIAAGDTQTAAACQKTMDSAALENSKIGQRLMELEK